MRRTHIRALTDEQLRPRLEAGDVIFFLGKAKSKKLKLQKSEILNAVWLELDDALHLVTHKDTAEVLRRALGYLTRD